MRKVAASLIAFLAASPAHAESSMTGTWFGQGQPDDKSSMYIDRMRADGAWRGEYRTCFKNKAVDQVQTGRWSLAGDILTLKVESVNGVPSPRTDTYKMLSHDAQRQKYVSMGWRFTYTPQRMPDDFQMPSCALTS